VGPRADLDGQKISSPPGFDTGPSSPKSVAIPTELPGPQNKGSKRKKLAASSMLHEAKIAYYAFDVIVYCMYTYQTRIAYTKRTH
jgi:hypothetical protein